MTQILGRTSSLLNGRHTVLMTPRFYLQAIVPIGVLYSLSLVCSNLPYLYLSVAFIQMLKGTAPIAVLFALSSLRLESPNLSKLLNLSIIVFGIVLASLGEIQFQITGFLYQMSAVVFEAYRLAFIQKLLKDDKLLLISETQIGKTSSLVLTLCGVLKNITLIGASMIIWGTVVTPIQFVGNGIAMAGLIYYNLGGEKILEVARKVKAQLCELCVRTSNGRRITIAVISLMGCLGLFAAAAVWFDTEVDAKGYLPLMYTP
ncbi:MAG: hypothetical protein Q9213_004309 [Squamulea squamosa]